MLQSRQQTGEDSTDKTNADQRVHSTKPYCFHNNLMQGEHSPITHIAQSSCLHLLPKGTKPKRHWWHISHTAFCQSSVFALTNTTKEISGITFMRYFLQQRWRANKRGDPCTSPFPSSSFTSTAEPSSARDPFSSQMPVCMKWKPIRLLLQFLLFYHDQANVAAVRPILSPVRWQFPGMLSWCCSGRTAYGIPTRYKALLLGQGLSSLMNPHTNTSTGLNAFQDTIQNNSANQHNQHTVCSTKFSRNGWLNNCAHMYAVNPDLFDLATQ